MSYKLKIFKRILPDLNNFSISVNSCGRKTDEKYQMFFLCCINLAEVFTEILLSSYHSFPKINNEENGYWFFLVFRIKETGFSINATDESTTGFTVEKYYHSDVNLVYFDVSSVNYIHVSNLTFDEK